MGAATLSTNSKKLDDVDAIIKSAYEKKRKLIEQSKLIVYGEIAKLYNLEGQALVDAVTKEHTLISKFTESGMSYNEIEGLADDAGNGRQTSFFEDKTDPYEE